jgi:hypothetical protein
MISFNKPKYTHNLDSLSRFVHADTRLCENALRGGTKSPQRPLSVAA